MDFDVDLWGKIRNSTTLSFIGLNKPQREKLRSGRKRRKKRKVSGEHTGSSTHECVSTNIGVTIHCWVGGGLLKRSFPMVMILPKKEKRYNRKSKGKKMVLPSDNSVVFLILI